MQGLLAFNSKGNGPYSYSASSATSFPPLMPKHNAMLVNLAFAVGLGTADQPGSADGRAVSLQQQGQWPLQPWGSWSHIPLLVWRNCCAHSVAGVLPHLENESCEQHVEVCQAEKQGTEKASKFARYDGQPCKDPRQLFGHYVIFPLLHWSHIHARNNLCCAVLRSAAQCCAVLCWLQVTNRILNSNV